MNMLPMIIGLAIVLAVTLFVLVVWVARRADDDRGSLVATSWLAQAAMWITAITAVAAAASAIFSPKLELALPVEPFWPGVPTGAKLSGTGATIKDAGFETLTVQAEGLNAPVRFLLAGAILLSAVTALAIFYFFRRAAQSALAGDPFNPAVARAAQLASVTVLVAGLASQVINGIAKNQAAIEVLRWTGLAKDCSGGCPAIETWWPETTLRFELSFWPIGAALALAAMAAIWRFGDHLQRETEGLI